MADQSRRSKESRNIQKEFFEAFYKRSGGNTLHLVSILDIGRDLGLPIDEAKQHALRLEDEGVIAYKLPDGRYTLTSAGLAKAQEAERELRDPLVFICYSHQDRKWLERLLIHLKPLVRDGTLDVWHDQRILAGSDWRKEIRVALMSAQVAVLLISADFFGSDFIASDELPPLIDAAEQRGTVILPLVLGPSSYERIPSLAKLQTFNSLKNPLSAMKKSEREEVLKELSILIEVLVSGKKR